MTPTCCSCNILLSAQMHPIQHFTTVPCLALCHSILTVLTYHLTTRPAYFGWQWFAYCFCFFVDSVFVLPCLADMRCKPVREAQSPFFFHRPLPALKPFFSGVQGKGIDCFATHPGIADTRLYPKLDFSKPEAKAFNAFESVQHLSRPCPPACLSGWSHAQNLVLCV